MCATSTQELLVHRPCPSRRDIRSTVPRIRSGVFAGLFHFTLYYNLCSSTIHSTRHSVFNIFKSNISKPWFKPWPLASEPNILSLSYSAPDPPPLLPPYIRTIKKNCAPFCTPGTVLGTWFSSHISYTYSHSMGDVFNIQPDVFTSKPWYPL